MREYSDIIIIGAGAAGLMAGIAAGGYGRSVLILEKMPRAGRKIVITGKGRCNMTNMKDWPEFSEHVHPSANFLKNAFFSFTPQNLVDFFNEHGLETVTERGDRVFPSSYKSMDVVDTLVRATEKAGAEIRTGAGVVNIRLSDKSTEVTAEEDIRFIIGTDDGKEYVCKNLIVTTGGLSYPATGSTGDGLEWAEKLGLSTVPCFPSLTAIVPKGYKATNTSSSSLRGHISRDVPMSETGKSLCGNQLKNISLKLFIDGCLAADEFGDLDFTDGGIEGPVGFKVSRLCVKALINGSKVRAVIDLKPAVSAEKLSARISSMREEILKKRRTGRNMLHSLLPGLIPQSLIQGFVKSNRLEDGAKLGRVLKNWEFEIAGFVGYERCVVTAGGISTKELSPKTLECKKIKGLYFAGEIIDIDADTGGYNLQCAFSTGHLAGQSAAKSLL